MKTPPDFINRYLPVLIAGVVIALIDIIFEISLAALLFSGPMAIFVPLGIGLLFFGAIILNLIISLSSSFPGMIAVPQDSAIAILAIIASSITLAMAGRPDEQIFATILAVIVLTSLSTGLLFLTLGYLRLSRLIRYIPFPVIGGFLAGTGWVIFQGGFSILTGEQLALSTLQFIFEPEILARLLPTLLFAIMMLIATRRSQNPLIIPVMLLIGVGAFYLWLWASGISIKEAELGGLLLGSSSENVVWSPMTLVTLRFADWGVIMQQALQIGIVMIISTLAMLFNTGGLEIAVNQDLDLDRELQSAGVANLVAGAGGSPVGYQTLSLSKLAHSIGASRRLVGIVVAAFIAIVLLFGMSVLAYFPVFVLVGVLLYLGLAFLVEWLYDTWSRLPLLDYASIVLILFIIAVFGFVQGVAVGFGIAIILFVYNYSQISIVKHQLTGETYQSSISRPSIQREYLRKHGKELLILQLQGYIFFGTAYRLLNLIREHPTDINLPRLNFVLLDLRLVIGIDSSAASTLFRLFQYTNREGIHLIFVNASPEIQNQLNKSGIPAEENGNSYFMEDLDHGLEYCENKILQNANLAFEDAEVSLQVQLGNIFESDEKIEKLLSYLVRLELAQNDTLIHQGDPADSLYFIESGMIAVLLEHEDSSLTRLRTFQGGTTVGEIGLYLGGERTATVVAIQPSIVFKLTMQAFQVMERDDPEIAANLHRWIVTILAERLGDNIETLRMLLE